LHLQSAQGHSQGEEMLAAGDMVYVNGPLSDKMARRSKYTAELAAHVVRAVGLGLSLSAAGENVGLDSATVLRWRQAGEQGRQPYADFAVAIKKAEANFQETLLSEIHVAARTTWQAGAWLLERRFPQYWSRHERMTTSDFDLRAECAKAAHEYDLPYNEVLAEARAVLADLRRR
jgi:hypothetical protein